MPTPNVSLPCVAPRTAGMTNLVNQSPQSTRERTSAPALWRSPANANARFSTVTRQNIKRRNGQSRPVLDTGRFYFPIERHDRNRKLKLAGRKKEPIPERRNGAEKSKEARRRSKRTRLHTLRRAFAARRVFRATRQELAGCVSLSLTDSNASRVFRVSFPRTACSPRVPS